MWKIFLVFCTCLGWIVCARNYRACPELKLENGHIRRRYIFAQFSCHKSFMLYGYKIAKCIDGVWDSQPYCVKNTCSPVRDIPNVEYYSFHRGAVIHFWCKLGYAIKGPSVIYCNGRKWSSNAPTCTPAETKPSLFCDFETEDMCGWTQDLNHDFDWTRHSPGSTVWHIKTGPTLDHTKGTKGHYMYIDASKSVTNETSRFISPIYDKTNETCLEFYYHMQHSGLGQLRVYVKFFNATWENALKPKNVLFSKSGFQGNHWIRGFVRLGLLQDDYQIVFEGVKGMGSACDIAIDDVKIIENCVDEEEISTTTDYAETETEVTLSSCYNRCGQNATAEFDCDCSDDCLMTNNCCVDFLAYCYISDTTEFGDFSEDERATKTFAETYNTNTKVSERTTLISTTTTTTTIPVTLKTITTTFSSKPTEKQTISKNVFNIATNNVKTINETNESLTTSTLGTTTIKKQKKIELTKATAKVLQPEPKQLNYTILSTTTPRLIYKNISFVNDSAPAFERTTITTRTTRKTTKKEEDYEILPPRKEDELLVNENIKPKTTKEKYKKKKIKLIYVSEKIENIDSGPGAGVIVGIVIFVGVLVVLVGFVIFRKYGYPNCWRLKRMKNSSLGDSQSDIRFLASDEMLDFRLATSDEEF